MSTPISQLSNDNVDSAVDDIINQINGSDSPDSQLHDMQSPDSQLPEMQMDQMPDMDQLPDQSNEPQFNTPINPHKPTPELQYQQPIDTTALNNNINTLSNTIMEHLKQPLIIMVSYIILNTKYVDKIFLYKNISLLVDADGNLTFSSIVIKAIIMGLLFYLIKMLVL